MKRKFINNLNWIIIGKLIQMLLGFIVGIYSTRYLGPLNYGIINYTASYISFFSVLVNLGIDNYIMKELIDYKDKQGEVLGSGIVLRILSSLLAIIGLYGILMITDKNDPVIQTVGFLQSLNLLFGSVNLISYWYQMQLKSKTTSIITTIGYAIMTVYKIYILILQKDIRYFAFTGTFETLLTTILLLALYRKDNGPKLEFSKAMAKDLLKNSYHFILSGLMVVIFNQTDKIMLKQMLDETATGFYSLASNLCNYWTFVLAAIITSANPIILESKKGNEDHYYKRIRQLYAAVIWISVFVSLIITVGAPHIIKLLYGEKYIQSVAPLRILTWSVLFSYLGVARGAWLVSEGLQRYVKYLTTIGAIANVVMNWLLIPQYGAFGAALATLLTQIIVNFIVPLFLKDLKKNSLLIIDAFLLKDVINFEAIKKHLKN